MIAHILSMAQLIVRNLDDDLVRDLKKQAGEHGISVEEEHRRILHDALRGRASTLKKTFWEALSQMPVTGDDSLFERDRTISSRGTSQELFED